MKESRLEQREDRAVTYRETFTRKMQRVEFLRQFCSGLGSVRKNPIVGVGCFSLNCWALGKQCLLFGASWLCPGAGCCPHPWGSQNWTVHMAHCPRFTFAASFSFLTTLCDSHDRPLSTDAAGAQRPPSSRATLGQCAPAHSLCVKWPTLTTVV